MVTGSRAITRSDVELTDKGPRVPPGTFADAEEQKREGSRQLTPAQRVALTCELSELTRPIARNAGLRT